VAGEVPPTPLPSAWLSGAGHLPSPAPRCCARWRRGERYVDVHELAAMFGKKPTGGHWNSGVAVLRNNGLIETDGRRRYRTAVLFRS
jgi:hypothetical protein